MWRTRLLTAGMLMASACSSSPQTESEGKRADDFIVSVDGIDHPTSSAQLEISFHSDGSNAAELSFQVDDEVPPTSAVLEPSLDQLRGRAFELSVIKWSADRRRRERGDWRGVGCSGFNSCAD